MKKYILEHDDYEKVAELLGPNVPHESYLLTSSVVVDLTEEEHDALVGAGLTLSENRVGQLCFDPPSFFYYSNTLPTGLQEYLGITNSYAAGFDGTGVKIALIDTGCNNNVAAICHDLTRMDFTGLGSTGDLFGHGSAGCMLINQAFDYYNHATAVKAGTACGAHLYSMRAFDAGQSGYIAAIEWCIANGIDIICTAVQLYGGLDSAITAALAAGIIFTAASGNVFTDPMAYPAAFPGVIAVNKWDNGTGVNGSYITGSGLPGVTVTFYSSGAFQTFVGGSSQASMEVAALLALYKQKYPSMDNDGAKNLLRRRALKLTGYTYDVSSNTRDTFLNYVTGAGFVAPTN